MALSAHHRYLVAKWLLISGLVSLVATIPLSIATWGSSLGVIVVFTFLYGLAAVAASTVLAFFNLIALRREKSRAENDGVK